MNPSVYLETTIVSYLAARTSRNLVVAAHQQLTRTWWDGRIRFDLFVSQAVVDEAADGNPKVAKRRLALLENIPVLALSSDVHELAQGLVSAGAVPAKATIDAIHIAVAALNHMEYLLTWNCAHIANAAVRGKIEIRCRSAGLRAPVICTPEQLMEP
jgi:hypothetical protein